MKKLFALALAALAFGPAVAQPSLGLSIGINQPGIFGRIDIGALPLPALVLPEPFIFAPPPYPAPRRPIYLYVPPQHQQYWGRYCSRYAACNEPVYFVRDSWVRERYAYEHPGWDRGYRGGYGYRGNPYAGRPHDWGHDPRPGWNGGHGAPGGGWRGDHDRPGDGWHGDHGRPGGGWNGGHGPAPRPGIPRPIRPGHPHAAHDGGGEQGRGWR